MGACTHLPSRLNQCDGCKHPSYGSPKSPSATAHHSGGTRPSRISLWIDEYGHSAGCATNPCFTGLPQQYITCLRRSVSSRMRCSQNRLCQTPRSCFFRCDAPRDLEIPVARENLDLIKRQRVENAASPGGRVHIACKWSGRITAAAQWKGRSLIVSSKASRSASISLNSKEEERSASATVKKYVAPDLRRRR